MWDMLGRAKWDAWARQKDLGSAEAKWHYVETLQKILRKYPESTTARDLSNELASFSGDPSNLVISARTSAQERESSSSAGSESDDEEEQVIRHQFMPQYPRDDAQSTWRSIPQESSEEDGNVSEDGPKPIGLPRPTSAISSQQRYRTPLGGMSSGMPVSYSPAIPPPNVGANFPIQQPLPRYSTPSAFSPTVPEESVGTGTPSIPSSFPTTNTNSYVPVHPQQHIQPYSFRAPLQHPGTGPRTPLGMRRPSSARPQLERAVESVQSSLAALRERVDTLEGSHSNTSLLPGSPSPVGNQINHHNLSASLHWDPSEMGLWSVILVPLSKIFSKLQYLLLILLTPPPKMRGNTLRSLTRRIVLDATFMWALFLVLRSVWRKTGIRRREVNRALKLVIIALLGRRERIMVDKGV
ncbi:uncharacterized protein EI90DRAFT_3064836 [Cantharellus anzutake]|uniref:uncharacterized protein n=1 Tax=Cantharellus anzutake TaxID=1750568 RepID=UPI0019045E14|nr:uncharacterized protein EI90DRAFT_3064836 [Cantharellus anzutake]KAF8328615.1 hypothetical protein EI90DRAFT_3064836 [Cantharellus anzutake]